MLAKVYSAAVVGLEGQLIEVEVDLLPGLPKVNVVGLPDTAVQEARERVRSAVRNSGCVFPNRRITVSLAPADIRKEGPSFDLPIAVGVVIASEQVVADTSRCLFLGELSLDGRLRSTHGVLPMVSLARERDLTQVFVPASDAAEAALVEGIDVYAVETFSALVRHLAGAEPIQPFVRDGRPFAEAAPYEGTDFAEVRGQEHVKRALEVAAAGGHNLLMVGPAGAGKTLLARALPSILPSMAPDEALMVTRIYSVAGLLAREVPLVTQRPFRAPHHTVSQAGLVGGGRQPRPGEISLSHRGVLFLDELPEFGQQTLEVLRQPMEDHLVTISRAQGSVTFPANFMLIAAMNPCPCGNYGDPIKPCSCAESAVLRYQRRISGPLLDRVDIFVEVPRVDYEKLASLTPAEPSCNVRGRVDAARQLQRERLKERAAQCNSEMSPADVRDFCQAELGEDVRSFLKLATTQLSLGAGFPSHPESCPDDRRHHGLQGNHHCPRRGSGTVPLAHARRLNKQGSPPMKSVYFAARFSRRDELNGYRAELEALGIVVTSRWLATEPRVRFEYSDDDWRALGLIDQEDILAADTLVSFTEPPGAGGNGGRHVELGMALALGRRVILVGQREHIFHHLPEVEVVESWPEALRLLAQRLDAAAIR